MDDAGSEWCRLGDHEIGRTSAVTIGRHSEDNLFCSLHNINESDQGAVPAVHVASLRNDCTIVNRNEPGLVLDIRVCHYCSEILIRIFLRLSVFCENIMMYVMYVRVYFIFCVFVCVLWTPIFVFFVCVSAKQKKLISRDFVCRTKDLSIRSIVLCTIILFLCASPSNSGCRMQTQIVGQ